MKIRILHMLDGALAAKGLTVIIDVFRAFSVECYLFARGASSIIPVGDANIAYEMKEKYPDRILAGERHGKILPGFDMGNSPSQSLSIDVKGKTVIHTTSAGTQGISNAVHADEVLGCGLVNAKATVNYIRQSGAEEVSLVCMGLELLSQTEEDNLCAYYIKSLLEGSQIDMSAEIEKLKTTSGAKFFDKSQNDVFPEADFHMCVELDKFDFVLRVEQNDDGQKVMRRIN